MLTQVLFWGLAAMAVISALLMITRSNTIYSALFLVLCFFSVAGLYVMLNAQFIAVAQVTVYAGAIMVLFLFTIMLLSSGKAPGEERFTPQAVFGWVFGLIIAVQVGFLITGVQLARVRQVPISPDIPQKKPGSTAWLKTPKTTMPGNRVTIKLGDSDLNIDPAKVDKKIVTLTNKNTGEKETATLKEFGTDTAVFNGNVKTVFDTQRGPDGDGMLNVQEGHILVAGYSDEHTADGKTAELHSVTRVTSGPGNTEAVGFALYTKFLYPFEAVSVLLLMAIIGAVLIAKKRKKKE